MNAEADDGSAAADLMRCFFQTEVSDPKFPELDKCVRWAKDTEEGRRTIEFSMGKYYREN